MKLLIPGQRLKPRPGRAPSTGCAWVETCREVRTRNVCPVARPLRGARGLKLAIEQPAAEAEASRALYGVRVG